MGGIFLWWWSRAGEIGHMSKATHGQSPCHLSGRAFTLKEEVPIVQKASRGILRRQSQVQRPWGASANPCFVVKEVVIVTDSDSYPRPRVCYVPGSAYCSSSCHLKMPRGPPYVLGLHGFCGFSRPLLACHLSSLL